MVTQGPRERLTSVEQSLVEHVGHGERLDLAADDEAVDEAAMRSWGESRTCRASVIRDILRGRLAPDPDPRGLRLRGARITGRLDLENLTTDVNLELEECLLEEGVLTRDARLASVILAGCRIEHPDEPPLEGAHLTCSLLILDRSTVIGHTYHAAVNLVRAQIDGEFYCNKTKLHNNGLGPVLNAERLKVDGGMFLDDFTAIGEGEVVVNLKDARVGEAFVFAPSELSHRYDPHRRLDVDGLTYAGVPERIFPRDWLTLLREGTPGYAAQPYQQLAAGYQALGDERQVRQALISQADDQLARTVTDLPQRLWGLITKVTAGYGYQPWRLVLGVSALVALSCALAVVLGSHGALAQTDKTATPGQSCTMIQQFSVGMDLNLPFGTSLARAACDLPKNPSVTAAWLTTVELVLRILTWAFAALFAASFAASIRKP